MDETDADHSDYRTLSEASERLTAVVDRVKKDRALLANKEKLNELQNQIDGLPHVSDSLQCAGYPCAFVPFVPSFLFEVFLQGCDVVDVARVIALNRRSQKLPKPGRKHVKGTSVSVVMTGKSAEVEMDLFSDLLLLSKKKQKGGKPMKCVAWIPLHCVLIRDSVSGGGMFPISGAMSCGARRITCLLTIRRQFRLFRDRPQ